MKPHLFALFAFLLGLPFLASAEKPNILFILADDLGWADTTLYGHTSLYETPHLERLAARGMTFDRAYTASPLCSPTRSSILTGLHPARTGLTAPNCHTPKINLKATASDTAAPNRKLTAYDSVTRLDPKYETLAERYKEEGYTTAHFGKWHLGAEPYSPFEHGFDIDIPHHHGPGPAGSFVAPWKFKNFKEKYPKEHIEDRMGDEAVAFMEKHKDEPFFLNYWQFSVHAPFDAKADLIEKYRGKVDPNDEQRSPTYAAMVQSLDDNVGKMLDALDRLGIADNTIIVFFSDNGGNMYNEVDGTTPTSNRPLRGGKANNWDGGVRVPAVIVWPGTVKAGTRNDSLITSTDFYPTLLEMKGMKPSPDQQFDGVSIVPALKGETQERGPIFTFFPHSTNVPDTLPPSASVYEDNWKLLRLLHNGENGAHDDRLFNLTEDIGERNNVAAGNPDRAASMAKQLDEFLKDTGAVYPKYNSQYDPVSAKIGGTGLKPTKDCSLAIDNDELLVKATEKNSHITLTLKQPLAPGDLKLRLHLRAPHPGNIALRWSEKGVKPLFFKDRLEHSKPFEGGKWETITIPFSAAQAVTSFRIDFMTPAGEIRVGKMEVIREGKVTGLWSVPVAGTQWLDLQEQFRRAAKSSPQIREEPLTADGRTLEGIFQHAEAPGSPLATIRYPAFQLPAVGNGIDKIELRFLIGFKDGESFVKAQSDGCRFLISANGKEVFGKEYAKQAWQPHSIDLTEFSGTEVTLQLQVDPLKNSAADWASWAKPRLWLHGDATAIEKQLRTATSLPTHFPISQLQEKLAPSDRTFRHSENHHIAVMDEHLDLATTTERLSKELPPAKVPLAPQMVVGEGAHPDNHTLVQILSPYGIAEVQFLAFPPSVHGGVEVECLGKFIAATPIQQGSVGQVTLFDHSGIAQQTIEPPFDGPYVLASGDFLEGDGELLAIASSRGGSAALYDSGGKRIQSFEIPKGKTQISDGDRRLLVYTDPKRLLTTIEFSTETREERTLDFLPAGRSVFASAFHEGHLWAGGPQPLLSHIYDIKPDNTYGGKDVGVEENEFWLGLPKEFEEELGAFEGKKEARHIRFAKYGHMRVDAMSPRYRDPENGEAFGGPALVEDLRRKGAFAPLTKQARKMWNPTFTHRQFRQLFVDWARQTDPETGLNRNMMQSQLGNIGGFEQLGE
ncbi:MAG: sulfatase, partial [Verrucomicrobiales bacterium]|nr:sulfatase [Verrucomicrobiales bacterium]